MAIPSWPVGLPAPRIAGYNYQDVDPCARTQMDAGNRRVRRRFITTPTDVNVQFRVSQAQLASFETFRAGPIQAGQAWYTMPLINGQGINQVRARMTGVPQTAGVDGATDYFDVTFAVETYALPVSNG